MHICVCINLYRYNHDGIFVAGLSPMNLLLLGSRLKDQPPSGMRHSHCQEQKHKLNHTTHIKLLLRCGICHIQSHSNDQSKSTVVADSGARKDSPLQKSCKLQGKSLECKTLRRRQLILRNNCQGLL